MKNPLLLAAACAALSLPTHAAVININDLAPDDAGNTISGFAVTISALDDGARTYTLTQTGNLDGGTTDDTLTFDLVYRAYTGSTFDGTDVTLGTAATPSITNVNWHSNTFTTGNTLSLSIANVSYTDGEGDETLSFGGFTAINPISYAGTPAGDIDYYVGLLGATTITGDPTFVADLTSNGTSPTLYFTAAGGPVRLRNVDFQFETSAIPEPSSTALLGLGLAGTLLLRRRP
eukprot:g4030.t1